MTFYQALILVQTLIRGNAMTEEDVQAGRSMHNAPFIVRQT